MTCSVTDRWSWSTFPVIRRAVSAFSLPWATAAASFSVKDLGHAQALSDRAA